MQISKEFFARIPASLLKDAALSPTAKLLYALLAAHADGRTGVTYVGLRTLERLLGCGRAKRERAQRELVRAGWVHLAKKRCSLGRFGTRAFVVFLSRQSAVAPFQRSGENAQHIFSHSQVGPSPVVLPAGQGSLPTSAD
jgi:hypothetical protein